MKKFKPGDIFLNRVKAYPKVEFFVNSGSVDSVYYNRTIQESGSIVSDGYLGLGTSPNPPVARPPPSIPPFSEGFEFAESWPNTLDTPDLSPTGSFLTADLTEGFEFAESWPNTLDTPDLSPTGSFVTADFEDGYENADGWPGT